VLVSRLSYATDGALVGGRSPRTPTAGQARPEPVGLVEVARMENYKGTIWAPWDASAPPFANTSAGYKLYLDLLPTPGTAREGGTEGDRRNHKWLIPLQT